jgi:hypothetical protein
MYPIVSAFIYYTFNVRASNYSSCIMRDFTLSFSLPGSQKCPQALWQQHFIWLPRIGVYTPNNHLDKNLSPVRFLRDLFCGINFKGGDGGDRFKLFLGIFFTHDKSVTNCFLFNYVSVKCLYYICQVRVILL